MNCWALGSLICSPTHPPTATLTASTERAIEWMDEKRMKECGVTTGVKKILAIVSRGGGGGGGGGKRKTG